MLDQIDLREKMDKKTYKELLEPLAFRLGELQRSAREQGIPLLVVMEGWDASGKGTLLNRVLQPLDPRGFKVYNTGNPSEEDLLRPYLWPFWVRMPVKGQIVFMNRSWYRRFLEGRLERTLKKEDVDEALEETQSFERQLSLGGTRLVKFFVHISKEEQKKRLDKFNEQSSTMWRASKAEWQRHKRYDYLLELAEKMLRSTNSDDAVWTVLNGHDERGAEIRMLTTMVDVLERKLGNTEAKKIKTPADPKKTVTYSVSPIKLDDVKLGLSLDREKYKKELPKLQKRLREIQYTLYRERIPAIAAFEGWDAAGKGGAIKRLTERLDPRGYEVHPVAAPNDIERAHDYLWRFWNAFPKAGHLAVFDRTWYGRVLVERVEGFCASDEWERAYDEINDMEAQWKRYGVVLVKFWLHIDPDVQLARFNQRQNTPLKQWKITDEDWRNREKWPQYKDAVEEMLFRTSTTHAPWTIIEADNKEYARVKVLKSLIDAAEELFGERKIKI